MSNTDDSSWLTAAQMAALTDSQKIARILVDTSEIITIAKWILALAILCIFLAVSVRIAYVHVCSPLCGKSESVFVQVMPKTCAKKAHAKL